VRWNARSLPDVAAIAAALTSGARL
jgi:hypothetical protein